MIKITLNRGEDRYIQLEGGIHVLAYDRGPHYELVYEENGESNSTRITFDRKRGVTDESLLMVLVDLWRQRCKQGLLEADCSKSIPDFKHRQRKLEHERAVLEHLELALLEML